MTKIWKKWPVQGLTLVGLTCFAEAQMMNVNPQMQDFNDRITALEDQRGVNPSPSMQTDSGASYFTFADLLYWHADVDNADWAFKNDNTAATPAVVTGPNHALDFKWSYGFRVGFGCDTNYDQWDTKAYYTWFQTSNSNALGTSGSQVGWDQFGLATEFSQGKIDWRIHYSVADIELGRWFYLSKHLAFRPHIGPRAAWIGQKVHESFTKASGHHKTRISNNFWGVGAAGGMNTTWTFAQVHSHNFAFFGDFAGALMYGHFDVDHSEMDIALDGTTVTAGFKPKDLNRNLLTPMLQGLFGVSWDTSFNDESCHFWFRLGYELQYWFKQNQMLTRELFPTPTLTTVTSYSRSNGDLGLQGLTVDLRFDF